MFVATAGKMCKHQGWQSEAVVPCILSLLDRGTQAPKETVFYSWLLDQSFGDRSPKDSPQSSSMYIWRSGSVLDEGGPGIEGEVKVNLQDTSVALAI